MTEKHQPRRRSPSRQRYAASHPAVTVHFDSQTNDRILELCRQTGHSRNRVVRNLVRQSLGDMEASVTDAFARGRSEGLTQGYDAGYDWGTRQGFANAKAKYALAYGCVGCHKPITIAIGSAEAKAAMQHLEDSGWGHADCVDGIDG